MSTWQPIETAPIDGTHVDLWIQLDEGGERHPNMRYVEGGPGESNDWQDISGMYELHGDCLINLEQVTHWMPRPTGPAGEADRLK